MRINLFDAIVRIRRHSPQAAYRLLDRLLPRIIPLAKGLGIRVRECDDTVCVLAMRVNRRTRNHLGTLYFGAQMTLIDLTVGVLLFQRFPPGPFGGVIKKVEAEFLKKARGTIRCRCEIPLAIVDQLEQVRDNDSGKAEAWVPFELLDREDAVVTHGQVLVAIKRFD